MTLSLEFWFTSRGVPVPPWRTLQKMRHLHHHPCCLTAAAQCVWLKQRAIPHSKTSRRPPSCDRHPHTPRGRGRATRQLPRAGSHRSHRCQKWSLLHTALRPGDSEQELSKQLHREEGIPTKPTDILCMAAQNRATNPSLPATNLLL